ncbi:MAG: hypothetical protein IIB57_02200 [Planctomycetes bacterium]|nr:hypothetical protein [Planctomycetota bacterium]
MNSRIAEGDDDAANAGLNQGVGAGWRLADVATGLQRDVGGRPFRATGTGLQCFDFGMRTGESAMPSLADEAIVSGDHASDHGVGFDPSPTLLCQMYSTFHQAPALVEVIVHA